jgi:adenylyltransferase/sulfurtransferase
MLQSLDRYNRQMILPGFGRESQERLAAAHALVVGCGALGCAAIDLLARAGVGMLTLVDRDVVEWSNLQRQTLFGERDAAEGAAKAEAAKRRVADINSAVHVHACVEHLDSENARELVRDCTVIVDGLDNYRTRFLLNDCAVSMGRAYIYAGAVGTAGMSMPVLAGVAADVGLVASNAPCLRCVFPDPPAAGGGETCDTVGVFGPVVAAVGAHAAAEAIKYMAGLPLWLDMALWQTDLRGNREHRTPLQGAGRTDCRCCGRRQFDFMDAPADGETTVLCGRNAVQVKPSGAGRGAQVNMERMARALGAHGIFQVNGGVLVGTLRDLLTREGMPVELTLFEDGRAIVRGTTDAVFAQSVYDRYIGS